jgi:hypothetical protein
VKLPAQLPLVLAALVLTSGADVWADRISDTANTKHNLSVTGPGPVAAISQTQICVFCHTPHGATNFPGAPLWNRRLSEQTYTTYTSSSLDAATIAGQLDQPAGSSKLCLSCHDGTLAISTVNVLGGQTDVTVPMTGTGPGDAMPAGAGTLTGFTRNLGVDLTNDHPISLTYDSALAATDGELFDPVTATYIDVARPGVRPPVPLEATGAGGQPQVQCGTCHDPHLRDTNPAEQIKFLRLNRFQTADPISGIFNETNDTVCLACHDKAAWSVSAHALSTTADELYTTDGANLREFPDALPVWRAACLNCHDTHTVHGARRLLREGTDSTAIPKSGGNAASEETCYQCHSVLPIIDNTRNEVIDVQSDFNLPRHMPITSFDQQAGTEVHDVVDADLLESQALLGKGNPVNRHVECSDCHNPHRVVKNTLFNSLGLITSATHRHETGVQHSNIASGVLSGGWGVEPTYGPASFLSLPIVYEIKKGDGGIGASTAVNSLHVTREYQICLKCHSDFGYDDNQVYPIGTRPNPGDSGGGTPPGTNNLTQYSNQAMEFQAPLSHQGEGTAADSGAGAGFTANNHRSWHPVIESTGRTAGIRNMSVAAFLQPWRNFIGTQTMYCSDCHGTNTDPDSVVPQPNRAWGPHGSENDFILKGIWDAQTGNDSDRVSGPTDPDNGLCFKCHDYETYADRNGAGNNSGFGGSTDPNLHAFHVDRIGRIRCSWCHIAVPHGFKNKGLLVNLNDVGGEAGLSSQEIPIGSSNAVYDQGPYYMNAKLKVITFATSGNWEDTNCGSASGQQGTGKDWMGNVCSNPP